MVKQFWPAWLNLLGQRSKGINSVKAANDIARYIEALKRESGSLKAELAEHKRALRWALRVIRTLRGKDWGGGSEDFHRACALCNLNPDTPEDTNG